MFHIYSVFAMSSQLRRPIARQATGLWRFTSHVPPICRAPWTWSDGRDYEDSASTGHGFLAKLKPAPMRRIFTILGAPCLKMGHTPKWPLKRGTENQWRMRFFLTLENGMEWYFHIFSECRKETETWHGIMHGTFMIFLVLSLSPRPSPGDQHSIHAERSFRWF